MMPAVRALTAIGVGLCLGLTLLSTPAAAAKKLDPDTAAADRTTVESGLSADPRVAIPALQLEAEYRGDPELFLTGARMAYELAEQERDIEMAETAEALAFVARDIGFYLAIETNYKATDWHPVSRERAESLGAEAALLATDSRSLVEEIEAEIAAAAEAERLAAAQANQEKEKKPMKPGTGLIAGGSAALVLGLGGVGIMGAGISMGAAAQRDVEALAANPPIDIAQVNELDQRGSTANVLAYVGGAVAGVGIAVGAALIVVGVKKRKAAGAAPEDGALSRIQVGGWALRDSAGLTLGGRF